MPRRHLKPFIVKPFIAVANSVKDRKLIVALSNTPLLVVHGWPSESINAVAIGTGRMSKAGAWFFIFYRPAFYLGPLWRNFVEIVWILLMKTKLGDIVCDRMAQTTDEKGTIVDESQSGILSGCWRPLGRSKLADRYVEAFSFLHPLYKHCHSLRQLLNKTVLRQLICWNCNKSFLVLIGVKATFNFSICSFSSLRSLVMFPARQDLRGTLIIISHKYLRLHIIKFKRCNLFWRFKTLSKAAESISLAINIVLWRSAGKRVEIIYWWILNHCLSYILVVFRLTLYQHSSRSLCLMIRSHVLVRLRWEYAATFTSIQ